MDIDTEFRLKWERLQSCWPTSLTQAIDGNGLNDSLKYEIDNADTPDDSVTPETTLFLERRNKRMIGSNCTSQTTDAEHSQAGQANQVDRVGRPSTRVTVLDATFCCDCLFSKPSSVELLCILATQHNPTSPHPYFDIWDRQTIGQCPLCVIYSICKTDSNCTAESRQIYEHYEFDQLRERRLSNVAPARPQLGLRHTVSKKFKFPVAHRKIRGKIRIDSSSIDTGAAGQVQSLMAFVSQSEVLVNQGSGCGKLALSSPTASASGTIIDCSPVLSPDDAFRRAHLQQGHLDHRWANGMLDRCIQAHRHDEPRKIIPGLRLIDCQNNIVVVAPKLCDYLALSYVWGQSTDEARRLPNIQLESIPQNNPKIIRDAIRATLLLKRRYLWVDQVCVDQNSESHKKSQIVAIGDIYRGAEATLVSLMSSSHSGIPGTSSPRQYTAVRAGKTIFLDSRCIEDNQLTSFLGSSAWASRAWCYQEGFFSKRLLFFGPMQMIFVCDEMCAIEPVENCFPETWEKEQYPPLNLKKLLRGTDFEEAIFAFSARDLTYPEDRLDAIRGYLAQANVLTYWGMPVSHTSPPVIGRILHSEWLKTFVRWLGWYGKAQSNKNKDNRMLPSWSWISGHAIVVEDNTHRRGYIVTVPSVHFESRDQVKIPLDALLNGVTRARMVPEASTFIYIKAPVFEINPTTDLWTSTTASKRMRLSWPPIRNKTCACTFWPDHETLPEARPAHLKPLVALVLTMYESAATFSPVFHAIVLQEHEDCCRRIGLLKFQVLCSEPGSEFDTGHSPGKHHNEIFRQAIGTASGDPDLPTLRIG